VNSLLRRITSPIVDQLRQGINAEKIALTIAIGAALGVFPLLGTTTALCLAAGVLMRLNQPVIHAVNYLMYPIQLLLIFFFVRLGEWVVRAKPVSFSIPELTRQFADDPLAFLARFGMTGLHGILGWMIVAVPLAFLLRIALLPALRRVPLSGGERC